MVAGVRAPSLAVSSSRYIVLTRLNDQAPKKGTGKKPAAAPFGAKASTKAKKNPLFEARPRNFGIGAYTKSCQAVA